MLTYVCICVCDFLTLPHTLTPSLYYHWKGPVTGSALELQNQTLSTSLGILARKIGIIVQALR